MALVQSLLTAMVRANGDALVMHVGERPYVVVGTQTINISTHGLNLDAMTGMLTQLLPGDSQTQLEEFGAVEYRLPQQGDDRFTVVAARGGDDIWIEIRRRRAQPAVAAAPIAEPAPAAEPVPVAEPAPVVVAPEIIPEPVIAAVEAPIAMAAADPASLMQALDEIDSALTIDPIATPTPVPVVADMPGPDSLFAELEAYAEPMAEAIAEPVAEPVIEPVVEPAPEPYPGGARPGRRSSATMAA